MPPKAESKPRKVVDDGSHHSDDSGEEGDDSISRLIKMRQQQQRQANEGNQMMIDDNEDENIEGRGDGEQRGGSSNARQRHRQRLQRHIRTLDDDDDVEIEEEEEDENDLEGDRMETDSNNLANSAIDFEMGEDPLHGNEEFFEEDEDYYHNEGEDSEDDSNRYRPSRHNRQLDEEEEDDDEEEEDEDEAAERRAHEEEEDDDGEDLMDQSVRRRLGGANGLFFNALTDMVTGFSSRVRPILSSIRQREDPSEVMTGLQELADNLLISTEDLLVGYFPIDQFAEALVNIMSEPIFEDAPEIQLLACRNISNLIEVIPSSVGNVVHSGAVPILCQKLLEIQYIDLAEQALSVSIEPFFFRTKITNQNNNV